MRAGVVVVQTLQAAAPDGPGRRRAAGLSPVPRIPLAREGRGAVAAAGIHAGALARQAERGRGGGAAGSLPPLAGGGRASSMDRAGTAREEARVKVMVARVLLNSQPPPPRRPWLNHATDPGASVVRSVAPDRSWRTAPGQAPAAGPGGGTTCPGTGRGTRPGEEA